MIHYPESSGTDQNGRSAHENGTEGQNDDESRYPRRERKPPSFYSLGSASNSRALAMINNTAATTVTVNGSLSQEDREEWQAAIDSELDSLRHHEIREVLEQAEGVKLLTTRFVFVRRHDEHGNVCRHKARLVVREFFQGNVEQTFALVVGFATVRMCLAVAVQRKYATHQKDLRTAFLDEQIDTDIYIMAPEGVRLCQDGLVLKLRRGLYGLNQAPRLCQENWKEVMSRMSFSALRSQECVYRSENVWLLLYVDDIIAMGPV